MVKIIVFYNRDIDEVPETDSDDNYINHAFLKVIIDDDGEQDLAFKIKPQTDGWEDTDDNEEIRTYKWVDKTDFTKITSENYDDYAYEEREYRNDYFAYRLEVPRDDVSTYIFEESSNYSKPEFRIKEKAANFKQQLERADYFTNRVKGAIYSNMPDPVAQALTFEGFVDAIKSATEEPSAKNICNAILTTLESIPIVSLPAAVVESIALGPVVWSNLRNCKRYVEEIKELNEDL
ncbi:hypothetical protein [Wukongibacter sp. M2B1]|uniref:hypothetical protein n=1 Tax=Wukongibacter sp. M2B1 TaxID=3088895 RepID=UPI003D79ED9A